MKQVIALILVLALACTTVFAAPLAAAGEVNIGSDALFGDVAAAPLTDEEAELVEGGIIGIIILGVVCFTLIGCKMPAPFGSPQYCY
jgi:hypothetical protein